MAAAGQEVEGLTRDLEAAKAAYAEGSVEASKANVRQSLVRTICKMHLHSLCALPVTLIYLDRSLAPCSCNLLLPKFAE